MFHGIYTPIITTFHSDGSLDIKSLAKLAERLVGDGVAGLVPLGTTGEASALDAKERALVVETCAKAVAGTNVELIVGVGSNSTAQTIEHIEEVLPYSPDGFLVVTPYYVRPSEKGIIAHFAAVADAAKEADADVMLYNIPARTGRYVSTEGLLACAQHKNITGVKQAAGSIDEETVKLLAQAPDDFSVLCGDDAFIAPMTLLGGQGAVAATSHFLTEKFIELVHSASSGDIARTRELHEKLLPVVRTGFAEPNPAVFKATLELLGEIECGFVRLPLVMSSKEAALACFDAVQAAEAAQ